MTINLTKGGSVNLSKESPGLTKVMLGAGWDTGDAPVDLDLWTAAVKADGKVVSSEHFCFFNNQNTPAMVSSGDNRTGEGDGDDEKITIDLSKLPPETAKVLVGVSYFNHGGKNLSVVQNAFVRAVNDANGAEIAKFSITGGASGRTLYFAEMERNTDGTFSFKATGEFSTDGLAEGEVTAKLGV